MFLFSKESVTKIKRVPKQCEVLVIGGGIIGSFIGYWIKTLSPSLEVTVVEPDSTVNDLTSVLLF